MMIKKSKINIFLISCILSFIKTFDKNDEFIRNSSGNEESHINYSHTSNDNLYFIFSHISNGFTSPSYLNNNSYDIHGIEWGEPDILTIDGKKDLYLNGLKEHKRYQNFLNFQNLDEIRIYSVNSTKAISSAECKLFGLYNISNNDSEEFFKEIQKIDKSLIPDIMLTEKKKTKKYFHLFEYIKDEPILKYLYDCPIMKNKININNIKRNFQLDNIKNSIFSEISKESISFINFSLNGTKKYEKIQIFCDAYISLSYSSRHYDFIYKNYKNSKVIEDYCNNYFALSNYYNKFGGHADKNSIIIMSNTMLNLIEMMENKIINKENDKIKMIILSGLSETISAMQSFLKIGFNNEYEWIPFNFNILFELRKYGNDYYVEMYYNDLLKMNITFETFKERIKKISLNEREVNTNCYIISPYNSDLSIFIIFFTTIIVASTFFLRFYLLNKFTINI